MPLMTREARLSMPWEIYRVIHVELTRRLDAISHIEGEAPEWGYDDDDSEIIVNLSPRVYAYLARAAAGHGDVYQALRWIISIEAPSCDNPMQRAADDIYRLVGGPD